ncbi:MAG: pyruvate formate lyase family protein [Victivallaceae bacterium]|nr:pyruvate formate lyase family protein [Victivallaceae bacterium]
MKLTNGVEILRKFKRSQKTINTWFYVQEIKMLEREAMRKAGLETEDAYGNAELLCRVLEKMPLSIPDGSAIAGSQDGAFSPSYALINPSFKVEEFAGYCDPCAIYSDVVLGDLTSERVAKVRKYWENTDYVSKLYGISEQYERYTKEVSFFMEPVTGHTIPDMRPFLKHGVVSMRQKALDSGTEYGKAMARSLEAVLILARRYRELAQEKEMAAALAKVPEAGAKNLREAVQSFVLLWQVMVIEQSPNPYAFSAGNIDRVFEPYFNNEDFDEAVALIRHLLCFYQVGNRCWAISQNIMAGGRDEQGNDLTSPMTEAALEAFFLSNDPQPALSVKVHAGTPEKFYDNLGRFFFTHGHLTPSLFNDDSIFPMLEKQDVAVADLKDYSIAGCQEPLIMGKASLNTTNTWLNLGKVLELALNDGKSTITGEQIGPTWEELGLTSAKEVFNNAETVFFQTLDFLLPLMAKAGNAYTSLLGDKKPVPFTSSLMDSFDSFRDMRDSKNPGVRYNASGCLIHGLGVVTDSLEALKAAMDSGLWSADEIREALVSDFKNQDRLQGFLEAQVKYANNIESPDDTAVRISSAVCKRVSALRNPAGKAFLADWSTPSTHLLYGYWVGATPDGRRARTMLGYGIDPHPEAAVSELPERLLSYRKLPYHQMTGGYASHIGICPIDAELENKGLWMRDRIIKPLFRLGENVKESPYYVYFNIDTAEHLRAILKSPEELVPSGVYIMRIHGTFVNFLDLSPAIQEDIIKRLEAGGNTA